MVLTGYKTDVGIKKEVNQDSLIIRRATTEVGEVTFISVCDGMGGLSFGELASAEAVNVLNSWFDEDLPELLMEGISDQSFKDSILPRIEEADEKISQYGREHYADCGTTMTAILLYNNHYATVNVGDSRIYKLTAKGIEQLTHDQSVVQQLLDSGQITAEEAEVHPQRSVLLQCVGIGERAIPDFNFGSYEEGDVFFACSDGFRHQLTADEIYQALYVNRKEDIKDIEEVNELKKDLVDRLQYLIEVVKERGERDNITVVACSM